MFRLVYVDDDVVFEVCHNQTMFCVVHEDNDVFVKANHDWAIFCVVLSADVVFSKVNHDQMMFSAQSAWTMTSSPRSVMTRRCSAHSTYRRWRRLRDVSWPDDVFGVVHVVYDFFSKVNHDQMMFCVVHVDYDVVPQVYHDQTMFFVVYVNYHATSSPRSIMTERCFAWFTWTTSWSSRSMTRRCSLRRGWCGLYPYWQW